MSLILGLGLEREPGCGDGGGGGDLRAELSEISESSEPEECRWRNVISCALSGDTGVVVPGLTRLSVAVDVEASAELDDRMGIWLRPLECCLGKGGTGGAATPASASLGHPEFVGPVTVELLVLVPPRSGLMDTLDDGLVGAGVGVADGSGGSGDAA